MSKRLFRLERLVAILLVGTILAWFAYEHWLDRVLVLTPDSVAKNHFKTLSITDSVDGGLSRARLSVQDNAWRWSFRLKPSVAFPFAFLRIDLTDSLGRGRDVSRYSRIEVELEKKNGPNAVGRLFLRQDDSVSLDPSDELSVKYNEALLPFSARREVAKISWDRFYIPGWWIGSRKISFEQARVDFSNIRWIEISSPEMMKDGEMELMIYKVTLRGKWIPQEDFFKALLSIWLCAAGIYVIIKYRGLLLAMKIQTLKEKELQFQAHSDALTGVLNRRGFEMHWDRLQRNVLHDRAKYSVIFADVDFFKRINDTLGHDRGDEVLRQIAKTLASHIRTTDAIVRWGGEEFLILCYSADAESARHMAEKLRKQVELLPLQATCSFGVAQLHNGDLDDAVLRADKALYRAKQSGRNRVEVAE